MARDTDTDTPKSTDALWERQKALGADLAALAEQTAGSLRDLRSDFTQQIQTLSGSIADQIRGTNTVVEKVAAKLEANAQDVANRSRPQYFAILGSMLAVLGVTITITQILSGLHDKPVDDKLSTITQNIADLTKNTAASFGEAAKATVARSEFEIVQKYQTQLLDMRNEQRNKEQAALSARVDKVELAVVPRSELQFHWDNDAQRFGRVEQHVAEEDRRLDGLVSPADTLKMMGKDLHDLELHVYGEHR